MLTDSVYLSTRIWICILGCSYYCYTSCLTWTVPNDWISDKWVKFEAPFMKLLVRLNAWMAGRVVQLLCLCLAQEHMSHLLKHVGLYWIQWQLCIWWAQDFIRFKKLYVFRNVSLLAIKLCKVVPHRFRRFRCSWVTFFRKDTHDGLSILIIIHCPTLTYYVSNGFKTVSSSNQSFYGTLGFWKGIAFWGL